MMLEGNNLLLRPITIEDTENIIKWRNNELVRSKFINQNLLTEDTHKWWLENMIETKKAVQFIIIEKLTGNEIGCTFIKDIDLENKKGELGYFIGEIFTQGRGLGSEAVLLTAEYGINELGLHKIIARAYETNFASIKVAKKAGFVEEGLLIDEVFVNGEFHNITLLGRVNNNE